MTALSASFDNAASPFGGFQSAGVAAAQMFRGMVDAGDKFVKKTFENLGKEGVAAVLKGMLVMGGTALAAAAAPVVLPAIAPLMPAITGIIGTTSVSVIAGQVANLAGHAANWLSQGMAGAVIDTIKDNKKKAAVNGAAIGR